MSIEDYNLGKIDAAQDAIDRWERVKLVASIAGGIYCAPNFITSTDYELCVDHAIAIVQCSEEACKDDQV